MLTCRYRLSGLVALLALLTLPWGGQALTVAQRGNQLVLDGTPTALTFAWGCSDAAMLPSYRALGFNTLLLRIDSLGTEELAKDVALAQAAADGEYVRAGRIGERQLERR